MESDNPGDAASHTIAHTFDLKPSQAALPRTLVRASGGYGAATKFDSHRFQPPDELLIRWHGLPRDSLVQIYLPDVDIEQVLLIAGARPGYGSLTAIDDHTLGCRVGDATYLPLPGGRPTSIAGLLTIQLPPTVQNGEAYHVTAHQISGATRSFVASFQLAIPVSTAHLMLPEAQRTYEVLSSIGETIAAGDRWRPVFDRYLSVLGSRLVSLGGTVRPGHPPTKGGGDGKGRGVRGKVVEIIYDCHGDFEGFVLETCDGNIAFRAREHRIWRLIELAAARRLPVTVESDDERPERVQAIALGFH